MSGLVVALCMAGETKTLAPDVTKTPFPKQSVQGKIFGNEFVPTQVIVRRQGEQKITGPGADRSIQYSVTFRTGKDFFADQEISLWVSIDPKDKFESLNLVEKPHRFFDKEGEKDFMWKGKKRNVGMGITSAFLTLSKPKNSSEIYSERFSARLALGKRNGSKIPGSIILVLPDKAGFIAGNFTALVK